MLNNFKQTTTDFESSDTILTPNMSICQSDYPLDRYQKEFVPYAEEYISLPDRDPKTVIPWMRKYIEPALDTLGDKLLILAHYYMGGEIVKLIKIFGGQVGDSYELALKAARNPEKKYIVEAAVHFMAESISVLANDEQEVFITNPKSGCTMEMHAKDYMVTPAFEDLNARYGKENILPICYMNTSGRLKAMTGAQGGSVCTSSNVEKIFRWALAHNKKILFMPDRYMAENVAIWTGIPKTKIAYWPGGTEGANFSLDNLDKDALKHFDDSQLICFASHCAVHSYYTSNMVHHWKNLGYTTLAHPECRPEVVTEVDGYGSTKFLWDCVTNDRANTKKYAVATENHMVKNLKDFCMQRNIEVVNMGEVNDRGMQSVGCGCATMSRNDPPHLVAMLDLLRQEKMPDFNLVQPGDVVNEFTGQRQRLDSKGQAWIKENACKALEKMIQITEA
ncbi:MAG: quinolinate synthetase [marine bacterium B5-7]|nr:MAG: quinolinate synthetase [marine bacterium B5-7]